MSRPQLRILLIDDDEDSFLITRHLLHQLDDYEIQLDWESTFEAGLKVVAQHCHDLYLIDYRLNGRNGIELIEQAIIQGCHSPLIILTGMGDPKIDSRAMQAGAADYLLKDTLTAQMLERSIRHSLERQNLLQALRNRADQLRTLASELTQAEQRERQRIARILHDHLQQLLAAAKIQVGLLRNMDPNELRDAIQPIMGLLDQTMQVSRTLTVTICPPILYDAGLEAALEWLAEQAQQQHGLKVHLLCERTIEPISVSLRVLLFEAIRELLFNVVKHADVDRASITLDREDDQIQITVEDRGAGFDGDLIHSRSGFGLFSIRERLMLFGGSMDIESHPDDGTSVTLRVPASAFGDTDDYRSCPLSPNS